MLQKWSEKEDQQLIRLVKKYGTNDWNVIRKHFKGHRTRDSVIKRWHGKLKYDNPALVDNQLTQKTKKINKETDKPAIKRKLIVGRFVLQKFRQTRSTSFRVLKSNVNNRFQRLRNFLQGSKSSKQKKAKQKKEQKVQQKSPSVQQSSESNNSMIWKKNDDIKLRSLVFNQGILNWQKIAMNIGCTQDEAIQRWKQKIYSSIKLDDKVGGFLKYSVQEDTILSMGNKSGLSWEDLMSFLPGRSQFSIQARWRRLFRPQLQIQLTKNKHYIMREFLKKIVQKRKNTYQPLQQPLQPLSARKNE